MKGKKDFINFLYTLILLQIPSTKTTREEITSPL